MFVSVEAQSQWSFSEGQYGTGISGNISTSTITATHGGMSGVFIFSGTGEENTEGQYYVMGEYRKSFSHSTGDFLMADVKLKSLQGAENVRVSMYAKIQGEYILLESHIVNNIWHTFSGVVSSSEFIEEILFLLQTTGSTSSSSVSAEVYVDNLRMQFGTGGSPYFEIWDSFGDSLTGVDDEGVMYEFKLHQNYPNPFNPSTVITYEVPEASNVVLSVFTILGQKLLDIVNTYQAAGIYDIEFNGYNLASGMYIYTLTAGDNITSKRMLLMK